MHTRKFNLPLLLAFALCLLSLNSCERPLKIAISKGSGSVNYLKYSKWLKSAEPNIECIDLYKVNRIKALEILKNCDGLLLTGGPDIAPGYYGKDYDSLRCEIDPNRDTLEFELIKIAKQMKLPILGVCRGEQILNVADGGSLVVDIPSDYGTKVLHRSENSNICEHKVNIEESSLLNKICKVKRGNVNSYHHQAIDKLADSYNIIARTDDGLPEAIEKKNDDGAFVLAVQWHPERLDMRNPLSIPIAKRFIFESKLYSTKHNLAN